MALLSTTTAYVCGRLNKTTLSPESEVDVKGKVVVITGSNAGIGKAAAFEMAKRGAHIVMACRDMQKAGKVAEEIKAKYPKTIVDVLHVDLGDLASVRECVEQIRSKYQNISILINNAGILYTDGAIRTTVDGFEMHMGVNHLGPFLFTMLLLDLLKAAPSARIVFTASTLHMLAELNLDDLMLKKRGSFGFKNWGPYNNSKLANMYFVKELAKRLSGTSVTTYAVCPGYVKTEVFRHETAGIGSCLNKMGLWVAGLSPEQGCETILYCSLYKSLAEESGKMYHFNHRWDKAMLNLDEASGLKLWKMCEDLVGISKKEAKQASITLSTNTDADANTEEELKKQKPGHEQRSA